MKRLSTTFLFGCLATLALPTATALAQEGALDASQEARPVDDAATTASEMEPPDAVDAPIEQRLGDDDPDGDGEVERSPEETPIPDDTDDTDDLQELHDGVIENAAADDPPLGARGDDGTTGDLGEDRATPAERDDGGDQPEQKATRQSPPRHSPSTIHNDATDWANHRVTSGLTGSTGLWRTDSAILGQNGLTRISLAGLFAAQDNFPVHGTHATHAGARLAVDLVFLKHFEGFFSYGITSDYADEGEDTRLVQTLGDLQFGVKGSSQIFDGFHLGGALHFGLAPGFGADWTSGVSFDFAPRLIASWDVRTLNEEIPLLLHLNLGAIFTNQDRVYDDYSPSAFDEFAFDLNRYNRLGIGLGVEFPLPWVTPFLEWNMALPITSSDLYSPTGKPVDAASAMEHRMSLGLKVTALPDLTFLVALDFGLNGEVASGVAATPNVAFAAGLSYAFDPLHRDRDLEMDEEDVGRTACLPPPEVVALEETPRQPPPRPVPETTADLPAAADAPPEEVTAEPRPRLFLMAGQTPRSGRITFLDGERSPIDVPAEGFELTIEPGPHEVLVQAEGFLAKVESLSTDEDVERVILPLTPRPAEELFPPGEVKIVIPAQPLFGDQGTQLPPASDELLDRIADALLSGKVARLRIEGHMDNRGDAAQQRSLSEKRANAIRDALIERGIDDDRLVAEGKGGARPIASNALSKGRLRNRRIELHVLPAATLEPNASQPADR